MWQTVQPSSVRYLCRAKKSYALFLQTFLNHLNFTVQSPLGSSKHASVWLSLIFSRTWLFRISGPELLSGHVQWSNAHVVCFRSSRTGWSTYWRERSWKRCVNWRTRQTMSDKKYHWRVRNLHSRIDAQDPVEICTMKNWQVPVCTHLAAGVDSASWWAAQHIPRSQCTPCLVWESNSKCFLYLRPAGVLSYVEQI